MCALTHSHMSLDSSINVTTHCNTLQHAATHCNILHTWCVCQNSPKVVQRVCYIGMDQHTATHCNTLQHTATYCIALQHTATYCHTLQTWCVRQNSPKVLRTVCLIGMGSMTCCANCSVLQCVAVCCAVRCSVLQCIAVSCSVLQLAWLEWGLWHAAPTAVCCAVCCAVRCSVLQWAALCCSLLDWNGVYDMLHQLQCVAVCCSALQSGAVSCNVLQSAWLD